MAPWCSCASSISSWLHVYISRRTHPHRCTSQSGACVQVRITALVGNTYHARVHYGRARSAPSSPSGDGVAGSGLPAEIDVDARPSGAPNVAQRSHFLVLHGAFREETVGAWCKLFELLLSACVLSRSWPVAAVLCGWLASDNHAAAALLCRRGQPSGALWGAHLREQGGEGRALAAAPAVSPPTSACHSVAGLLACKHCPPRTPQHTWHVRQPPLPATGGGPHGAAQPRTGRRLARRQLRAPCRRCAQLQVGGGWVGSLLTLPGCGGSEMSAAGKTHQSHTDGGGHLAF